MSIHRSWIVALVGAALLIHLSCSSKKPYSKDAAFHDVATDVQTQHDGQNKDGAAKDALVEKDLSNEGIQDSSEESSVDASIHDPTIVEAFPQLTFSQPVDIQHAPDGSGRLFIVEKGGKIQVFKNSAQASTKTEFLNVSSLVTTASEAGLLGLAFHPKYKTNGTFFISYVKASPLESVLARYQVSSDPNKANAASGKVLFTVPRPQANHDGGQIAFGSDGYLYMSIGDGGKQMDPDNNGQSLNTLLGKILRIDIDQTSPSQEYGIPSDNPFAASASPGTRHEIYAYGFRNPWRFSFDPVTKKLWVGDVGQNTREEISIVEKGKNYGWNIMEGSICQPPKTTCDQTGLVPPVIDYGRSEGFTVIGGYVYRGTKIAKLQGRYIYGDFGSGKIWSLAYDGVNPPDNQLLEDTDIAMSTFGVDDQGEIYLAAFDGKIRVIK